MTTTRIGMTAEDGIDWDALDLESWGFGDRPDIIVDELTTSLLNDAASFLKDAVDEIAQSVWQKAAAAGAKVALAEVFSSKHPFELWLSSTETRFEISIFDHEIQIYDDMEAVLKSPSWNNDEDTHPEAVALAKKLREIADYLEKTY